jgi:Protein of unknown function (DUF3025)
MLPINIGDGLIPGRIDSPGWSLYRDHLAFLRLAEPWPTLQTFNALLGPEHPLRTKGIQFEAQPYFPRRRRNRQGKKLSYETYIFEQGFIPTRDASWHDLFNAVIWSTLPLAKLALSQAQRQAQQDRIKNAVPQRSPLEDCLTMFDEGGVFTVVDASLASELQIAARDAREDEKIAIFRKNRAEMHIFGHGILEGIVGGDRGTRAICFVVPRPEMATPPVGGSAILDFALAGFIQEISAGRIPPRGFGGYPIDSLSAPEHL